MSEKLKAKKRIKIQSYTVVVETSASGRTKMTRTNSGFNTIELLGVLELTREDIIKTVRGELPPPTIIRRRVVITKED